MTKINASLGISRPTYGDGRKMISIQVQDEASRSRFLDLEIGYEEFAQAVTGLTDIKCTGTVRGLDIVGKTMEHKTFEFPFQHSGGYVGDPVGAYHEACRLLDLEDWKPDSYFSSKDSFFVAPDGTEMARCTIRRWV